MPSQEPVFTLASVDLYRLEAPTHHIARFMPSLKCGPFRPLSNADAHCSGVSYMSPHPFNVCIVSQTHPRWSGFLASCRAALLCNLYPCA